MYKKVIKKAKKGDQNLSNYFKYVRLNIVKKYVDYQSIQEQEKFHNPNIHNLQVKC